MDKKNRMRSLLGGLMIIALIAGSIALRRDHSAAYDRNFTWYVDYDAAGGKDVLVRGTQLKNISADINKVIIALNRTTIKAESSAAKSAGGALEPPRLILRRVGEGIAYVEVINAEYLTQRMGTSGAQNYLAAVTYSLTETPGIKGVDYSFPEGDHAMPGEYTRESFPDYTIAGK